MLSYRLLIIVTLSSIVKVISSDAIPQAPASAPALPNIPGLSAIVDDLMKVVEKAKSRWDALQNGYGSGGQNSPFQALLENEVNSFTFPLPYQFQNEQLRRSSQINPVASPMGSVYIPKNAAPSMKLIHRPAAPVSNCLYGKTGTLCQDLSNLPLSENANDWEDLFANVQLTEY